MKKSHSAIMSRCTRRNSQRPVIRNILNTSEVQAKRTIGPPNYDYEQEADKVANQLMSMPKPSANLVKKPAGEQEQQRNSVAEYSAPDIQRFCPECEKELQRKAIPKDTEEEELLQTKQTSNQSQPVSGDLKNQIDSLNGSGQPLPRAEREFFEPRFNTDFSSVRIHTDSHAHDLANSVNAQAFTVGHNIVFGAGHYASETNYGKHLLAHELTHIVQQNGNHENAVAYRIQRIPRNPKDVPFDGEIVSSNAALRRSPEKPKDNRNLIRYLLTNHPVRVLGGDVWIKVQTRIPEVPDKNVEGYIRHDFIGKGTTQNKPKVEEAIPPKSAEVESLESKHGAKCVWPPINPAPQPVPTRHSWVNSIVISKLLESYLAHAGGSSGAGIDYFANGFLGRDPSNSCTWPASLWEAFDIAGVEVLDVVGRVRKRAELYTYLWNSIDLIRNTWSASSSKGFAFKSQNESSLESWLMKNPNFCRDVRMSECDYHKCQKCWREVGRVGVEGLHICLGAGEFPNIHIDPHQIAEARDPDGKCKIDWITWGVHAKDVVLPGWNDQNQCVIGQGGCRYPGWLPPGGIPSDDDIQYYNEVCKKETGYTGPVVFPTEEDCKKTGNKIIGNS